MKKIIPLFISLTIFCTCILQGFAKDGTSEFLYKTITNPTVSQTGGEWTIIGLSRGDVAISDEYFQKYYENTVNYITANNGVLHDKKYTEYSRVVLALTAIGKNPENIANTNLITPLTDYDKTVWQGINGAIWGLIALNSKDYGTDEIKERYLDYIINSELPVGGFTINGEAPDTDITAMALVAIAPYSENPTVAQVIKRTLETLSAMQTDDGGFKDKGSNTCESTAQVIVALSTLGISPDDERFVKNGISVLDNLMSYKLPSGGFSHIPGGSEDIMATEQALCAISAYNRFKNNQPSLYDFKDVVSTENIENSATSGLDSKHPDVNVLPVTYPDKTFSDTSEKSVLALASRGIINGKTETTFEPKSNMTRAEFATIIVRGLGLKETNKQIFIDVLPSDWYFSYVSTAKDYGIINGVSETEFNPKGTITKQEAAVMIARAAKLCGMITDITDSDILDSLCVFTDYMTTAPWAKASLAFCYNNSILPDEDMEILPTKTVTRLEIADMLYNMLTSSMLI